MQNARAGSRGAEWALAGACVALLAAVTALWSAGRPRTAKPTAQTGLSLHGGGTSAGGTSEGRTLTGSTRSPRSQAPRGGGSAVRPEGGRNADVVVWMDDDHVLHAGAPEHPEAPARVLAIRAAVLAAGLPVRGPPARLALPAGLSLQAARAWTLTRDPDTYITQATRAIAERAHAMVREAVAEVVHQRIRAAFVALRPPGHHASAASGPRGFCHSNNAWVAVQAAQGLGVRRIAILDWDAHHGDGTEEIVQSHNTAAIRSGAPTVRFVSMHCVGAGVYPETGDDTRKTQLREREAALPPADNRSSRAVLNIAFERGTGARAWMAAFEARALPFLSASDPQLLIVSAGYDAHIDDPMRLLKLTSKTYGRMAQRLAQLRCPVLFVLEGGYNPAALAESVLETLRPFAPSAFQRH